MQNHRWTSRKFLISLCVQVTAIAVLVWPEHESAIVEAGRSITALVVMLLSGLGYVTAEASLDRRRAAPGGESGGDGVADQGPAS